MVIEFIAHYIRIILKFIHSSSVHIDGLAQERRLRLSCIKPSICAFSNILNLLYVDMFFHSFICLFHTHVLCHVSKLHWRHNGCDSVSNHQPHDCLLSRIFGRRSKKTSKLRVTGLCAGNSSGTGEFPAQMASNAENVSIWWRHHENNVPVIKIVMCKNGLLSYGHWIHCGIITPFGHIDLCKHWLGQFIVS